MSYDINHTAPTPTVIEPSFSWTPTGVYTFTSPDGLRTLVGATAPREQAITFTATSRIDNQGNDISGPLTIVEYCWDFGDGVLGYGNPCTHTYSYANPYTQVVLRLTDSKGRYWYCRQQVYIGGQETARQLPGTQSFSTALTTSFTPPVSCPNLLTNPSFELPIFPDVSIPVGGWGYYQNDPYNSPRVNLATFARETTWASDGTHGLELATPVGGPAPTPLGSWNGQFNVQPINPSTFTADRDPVPNGWWPVVAGRRYRWKIDAFGVANADYSVDPGGTWIGIDFYDSAYSVTLSSNAPYGLSPGQVHVRDGVAVLDISTDWVAPPDAAWAVPWVALRPVSVPPAPHVYIDNAFWGDVTTCVSLPSPAIMLNAGALDAPTIEALIQVVKPDGTDLTPLATAPGYDNFGLWWCAVYSGDGAKLAASGSNGPHGSAVNQLWIMDSNGQNPSLITNYPASAGFAGLSLDLNHDGSKIACPYDDGTHAGICVINTDNSGYVLIQLGPTGTATINDAVEFSPDGTKFAFSTLGGGAANGVSVCNSDGTGIVALGTNYFLGDWYADSAHLLLHKTPFPGTLLKVALDGSTALVYDLSGDIAPSTLPGVLRLSPDNLRIAWVDGNTDLHALTVGAGPSTVILTGRFGTGATFLDWTN